MEEASRAITSICSFFCCTSLCSANLTSWKIMAISLSSSSPSKASRLIGLIEKEAADVPLPAVKAIVAATAEGRMLALEVGEKHPLVLPMHARRLRGHLLRRWRRGAGLSWCLRVQRREGGVDVAGGGFLVARLLVVLSLCATFEVLSRASSSAWYAAGLAAGANSIFRTALVLMKEKTSSTVKRVRSTRGREDCLPAPPPGRPAPCNAPA
eukprot:CAMPEP_0117681414 /NCGR_PEP_ID=MMETSP0804-20121206/18970_1 /TAXON_ID=1074897 /ORGANISM="Tetraselmis astigmatica, Strain CCMP880" /LENGTH=210 /DNA_ID=CAMNT_0005491171 /DNA_START=188 /DNA_END=818 /DNA_ORIENTATION=+